MLGAALIDSGLQTPRCRSASCLLVLGGWGCRCASLVLISQLAPPAAAGATRCIAQPVLLWICSVISPKRTAQITYSLPAAATGAAGPVHGMLAQPIRAGRAAAAAEGATLYSADAPPRLGTRRTLPMAIVLPSSRSVKRPSCAQEQEGRTAVASQEGDR